MHQGLAFHELLMLLKVLKVFNCSKHNIGIALYAPHHDTYKRTIKYIKKQSPNSKNNTKQRAKTIICFETITWI
jgi:hypothetical protein